MHLLWLCSWYPNPTDRFDGDFIGRHAAALAALNRVHVIHLVQNHELLQQKQPVKYLTVTGGLSEEIHVLPFNRTGVRGIDRLLFNLRYYQTYRRLLRAYISRHGKPELVHVHVPVKAAAAARWLQRRYGIPFVVTEHSSAYDTSIPHAYQQRNWFFRHQTKAAFTHAAAVSSVSYWLLHKLQQLFAVKHIRLIPNCVDIQLFFPLEKTKVATRFRFIHVSMLVPLKNLDGILHACQNLLHVRSDWELVVVGPAGDALRQQAAAMGIEGHVIWAGLQEYAAVAKELQQADALVHFSNYENLPCVINEALCCGLPVISSNVGGIAEIVNASNGIIVPAGNVTALQEAMLQMINQQTIYHRNAIAAAAAMAFSYAAVGKELMRWYSDVLNKLNC